MTGETNLNKLLKTLKPDLKKEEYVYCTLSDQKLINLSFKPICTFIEEEGITIICSKNDAQTANLNFVFTCRMITLTIHSSLEAVGLTAAVSTKLAHAGISANVIAAYYHDHIFVPTDKAEEAIKLLKELSS